MKCAVEAYLARQVLKYQLNKETLVSWKNYTADRAIDGDKMTDWLDDRGTEKKNDLLSK